MDLGSFLLIIALAILAGIFVSQPFFKVSRGEPLVLKDQVALIPDHERSALLAERYRLLASLSELDFDQALGKIPAKDYLPQRAELLRAGAEILRKLMLTRWSKACATFRLKTVLRLQPAIQAPVKILAAGLSWMKLTLPLTPAGARKRKNWQEFAQNVEMWCKNLTYFVRVVARCCDGWYDPNAVHNKKNLPFRCYLFVGNNNSG